MNSKLYCTTYEWLQNPIFLQNLQINPIILQPRRNINLFRSHIKHYTLSSFDYGVAVWRVIFNKCKQGLNLNKFYSCNLCSELMLSLLLSIKSRSLNCLASKFSWISSYMLCAVFNGSLKCSIFSDASEIRVFESKFRA